MFLSFIVPVYNVEKYVAECLDSLLNQDIPHEDYEIICVNDGSTDGSLSVLREYEKKYSNIQVIDQPNSGVATARNVGLDVAVGEYIWFVDSDDFILTNILRKLQIKINNSKVDRVTFGSYTFKENLAGNEMISALQGKLRENCNLYNSNVFTCIMRRAYLLDNNHRFHYPELAYGEDCVFMYELLSGAPQSAHLEKTVYFYRQRAGSAMSVKSADSDKRRIESHVRICEIINGYYLQSYGDGERTANCLMTFLWLTLHMITKKSGEESRKALDELRRMGLFPFKRPAECTIGKSYQTMRKDVIGKMFDWIYLHTHTRLGLFLMQIWVAVERIKHGFSKE